MRKYEVLANEFRLPYPIHLCTVYACTKQGAEKIARKYYFYRTLGRTLIIRTGDFIWNIH